MVLVYSAERLNALGTRHWQKFAGQNYFDTRGIFTSALLSAPLMITMFAVLVRCSRPGPLLALAASAHSSCLRTRLLAWLLRCGAGCESACCCRHSAHLHCLPADLAASRPAYPPASS